MHAPGRAPPDSRLSRTRTCAGPPGSAPEPSRCRDDMADHAAEPVSRRMRHHGSLLPVTDRLGQLPRKSGEDHPVHSRPPGGISDRIDRASIRSAAQVASAAPREDSQPPNAERSHTVTIRLCDCKLDYQACSREPIRIRDAVALQSVAATLTCRCCRAAYAVRRYSSITPPRICRRCTSASRE
jgi:hypothetical protein